MIALLDVNLLIALLDQEHVNFSLARAWFSTHSSAGWATCPITENSVLRIMGHRSYPGSPGSPAAVMPFLAGLVRQPGHIFWPDSVSLLDAARFGPQRLLTAAGLTDSYLLALAVRHGGRFATLDRRIVSGTVVGGSEHLDVIE